MSTPTPKEEQLSLKSRLEVLRGLNSEGPLSVGEILDVMGKRSFGVLLVVLSMPSALPVPAPGYSTPFGVLIVLLSLQMVIGKRLPWLPGWAMRRRLGQGFFDGMVGFVLKVLGKVEYLIRGRMGWVCSRAGGVALGLLMVVMGGLMILPIPLTNTLPAMVVFALGVGIVEGDGLLCLGGVLVGMVALAGYIYALYLFMVYGVEAVVQLREWIVDFFSF